MECSYAVRDARIHFVQVGCSSILEGLLTDRNPTVAHLLAFRCQVWGIVPDEMRKRLDAKKGLENFLRSISSRKYGVVMESDSTVTGSPHFVVKECAFSMEEQTSVVQVNKENTHMDTNHEKHWSTFEKSFGRSRLELRSVPVEPKVAASSEEVAYTTFEATNEKRFENRNNVKK